MGRTYGEQPNLLAWMASGFDDGFGLSIVGAIAEGIRSTDKNHVITYHPKSHRASTDYLPIGPNHNVAFYHSYQEKDARVVISALRTLDALGAPFINIEPCYEGSWSSATATASEIEQIAKACASQRVFGMAYGHHSVWGFTSDWKKALTAPGVGKFVAATKGAVYNK